MRRGAACLRLAWLHRTRPVAPPMAFPGSPAPSQPLVTAVPARVLERVTVREPEIPAQFRSADEPGHGYERTVERLQLCAERKCLKVTVVSDQVSRYESTWTFTIHCGTYEPLPGDRTRLSWTKKLSNYYEMGGNGAYGTPAQAWAVETPADADREVASAEGWSLVEDATTTIVDESEGYDGRIALGKTRILGLEVPCRGPAHIPSDFCLQ